MSNLVQRLEFKAHPRLEKILGYGGESRWIAWHWEPEINQVTYFDGQQVGTGAGMAWQVFLEHPQIHPFVVDYHLGETEDYWLLLDCHTRNVYVGEGKVVQSLLEQPESLTLLGCLDREFHGWQVLTEALQDTLTPWKGSQITRHLKAVFPIGIAATLIATVGIGSWLWLKPAVKLEKAAETPSIVIPDSPQVTCGLDGSNDFTAYEVATEDDKELHLIGVYEARSDHGGDHHPPGTIAVTVQRQEKPLVLALSSYEPVEWQLNLEPGVIIEKIILNGYYDQSVVGVNGVPVVEYSYKGTGEMLGSSAYQWGSDTAETSSSLVPKLEKMAGVSLTSFQGCYRGTEFRVPG